MHSENSLNQRRRAIVLSYDHVSRVPKVIASGAGELANRILELAVEHNIPIEQNSSLTELLSGLEIEQQIPEEAFRAVATILAFLYGADEQWRVKKGFINSEIISKSPQEKCKRSAEEPR